MDINLLFEAGEMDCGRVLKVLPEKDIKSPKHYMAKVLRVKTMPSINRLYPVILKRVINLGELEFIGENGGYSGWRIPSHLVSGLPIQSIKTAYPGGGNIENNGINGYMHNIGNIGYGAYPNRFGRMSSANIYEGIVSAQIQYLDLQAMGQIQEAPTPKFEKPNIIWLNNAFKSTTIITIEFCLDNDENLITLDNSVYEGVRRLFVLDLKSAIYNEFSTWSNLDTSLGTIDLKIDEWSGAESERNELFDQFDSLSHLRRHAMKSG